MMMLFDVLPQQIFAVVVSIGRPQHGVDVIPTRLARAERGDASLMIKLDQDHGAVDSVIENTVV